MAANAAIYSLTFQGVTFNLNQDTSTHATFQILGTNNMTGDWAGAAYLGAFAFGGLGPSQATATLIVPPTGASDVSAFGGLNANGCDGAGAPFICFDFVPNIAVAPELKFDIVANTGTFNIGAGGPDLKILFTNSSTVDTTKVGSLLSAPVPGTAVPEPATWAMLIFGFGLVGAGMRMRRRQMTLAAA